MEGENHEFPSQFCNGICPHWIVVLNCQLLDSLTLKKKKWENIQFDFWLSSSPCTQIVRFGSQLLLLLGPLCVVWTIDRMTIWCVEYNRSIQGLGSVTIVVGGKSYAFVNLTDLKPTGKGTVMTAPNHSPTLTKLAIYIYNRKCIEERSPEKWSIREKLVKHRWWWWWWWWSCWGSPIGTHCVT